MAGSIRGGKGIFIHTESYDGPDNPFAAKTTETPTLTCFHCQVVVHLHPDRTRKRSWCRSCNAYICDPCAAAYVLLGCQSMERTMELKMRFPDRDIRMYRGANKEPLGDEITLAEATKPYQGVTLPEGSQ